MSKQLKTLRVKGSNEIYTIPTKLSELEQDIELGGPIEGISQGAGSYSLIFGDEDVLANGDYTLAGGTNDIDLVSQMLGVDITSISDSIIEQYLGPEYIELKHNITKTTNAEGDMSMAFGLGAQAQTLGGISLGVATNSGCKGFYWFTIDFTSKIIQLTTTQKRYSDGIFGGIGANKNPVWDDTSANELAKWSAGDIITINNGENDYNSCITITNVNSTAGTITVESLPFTTVSEHSTLTPYVSPTKYLVCCPTKPSAGTVNIAFAGTALGLGSNAAGSFSLAQGGMTLAAGEYAHAEGNETEALGTSSHAEGYKTVAGGSHAHTEGKETIASGDNAHAEGAGTEATGENSHAEGVFSKAEGQYSHAENWNTTAAGVASHAEGKDTVITVAAEAAHAEGNATTASGKYAHAEGNGCQASGEASHAQGYHTTASGLYSTAMGEGTKALGRNQLVIGKYNRNVTQNNLAFIVGGGSGDEAVNRKDVATIDWNGNAHFTGNAKAKRLNIGVSSVPEDALIAINTNNGLCKMDVDGHLSVPALSTDYGIDTFSVYSNQLSFSDGYGTNLECNTIATGTLASTSGNNVFVVGDGRDIESPEGNGLITQYSNALEIDKDGNITTKGYVEATDITAHGNVYIDGYVHSDDGLYTSGDIIASHINNQSSHTINAIRLGEMGDNLDAEGFSIVPPLDGDQYITTYRIDMQGNVNQKGTLTVDGKTNIKNLLSCEAILVSTAFQSNGPALFASNVDVKGGLTISDQLTIGSTAINTSNLINIVENGATKSYVDESIIGKKDSATGLIFGSYAGTNKNEATGSYSTAFGYGTKSTGAYSFTSGYKCQATSTASIAIGQGCIAKATGQVVIGKFNDPSTAYCFIIGGGSGEDETDENGTVITKKRANAMTVNNRGHAVFKGTVAAAGPTLDGHLTTKYYVDKAISTAIANLGYVEGETF